MDRVRLYLYVIVGVSELFTFIYFHLILFSVDLLFSYAG